VSQLEVALLGGFVGGSLGVAGTLVTSYFGPRKLEECRRLLIAVGARGVLMRGQKEGWALIERYPLDRDPDARL
jgi:hypothetical protein